LGKKEGLMVALRIQTNLFAALWASFEVAAIDDAPIECRGAI
jgi:hypothetical protein